MEKIINFFKANWKLIWFMVAAFCFMASIDGPRFWWIAFQICIAPITLTVLGLMLGAGIYAVYIIIKCIANGSWEEFEELLKEEDK